METVSAADFQRQPGLYQDHALVEPVVITRNGRERLVLLSAAEFHRLKRRDREVLTLDAMTATDLEAIRISEAPAEAAAFDHELKR